MKITMKNCMKSVRFYITMIAVVFTTLSPDVSIADGSIIAHGTLTPAFSSWGKKSVKGSWKIVKEDQTYVIVLGDDFAAKNGPDVKVFLSPKNVIDIEGSNATEGSLFVTQITQFKGQYRIALPNDVNLDSYQSLVFHCEEYSKLWGMSPIQ